MDRKVLFEVNSSIPSSQYNVINYPPQGYGFVMPNAAWNGFSGSLLQNHVLLRGLYHLARLMPLGLIKSYAASLVKNYAQVDLVYAFNHLVLSEIPWVVWVEWLHMLAGFHIRHVWTYNRIFKKAFSSKYCKAILVWSSVTRRNILSNLDGSEFEQKIHMIYPAVPRRESMKRQCGDKVKILFVGSGRTPNDGDFHTKGGKEVLEMFTILEKRGHNIELVVRSKVPEPFRSKARRCRNIKLLEEVLPRETLEEEFKTSDILVHPTHFPLNTIVPDAMSYGIPVVVTDIYNYREWVEDGVTGLLVKAPEDVPYFWKDTIPPGCSPIMNQYNRAMFSTQWATVHELVDKVGLLVSDEKLRRRIGNAARREVEEGKLSIENRNSKLKKIFDDALAFN